ncbi:MAG TPA: ATP-binding protein, partial [Spirochaetia bacterium]|nr:ATP-binding protein [Spirochaetia bacterium]
AFAGVSRPAPVFLNGKSMEEIEAAAGTVSPKTAALYISLYQDGQGKTFNPRDALDRLVTRSRVPVYGVSSTYLGHGIVGGNLLSFEDVSANAAQMALQILGGRSPESIAPRTSENRNYFDWPQLQRWGIQVNRVPAGSVVLNEPPDPWVVYRWQILGTVAFLAFETALLVLLVSLLRIRSRTQRTLKIEIEERNAALLQLHESEQRYRLIFENSGTANAIVDLLGTVVLCNTIFADLLGQTRETLEGRSLNGRLDRYDGPLLQVIERTWKTGEFRAEAREMTLPGTQGPRWLESYWYALHLRSAGLDGVQVVIRDVTENKKLNEKLSQVQRLESIGVLAGGIAHDFNNLLSGLWGYLELARMNLVEGESLAAAGRLEKATRVFHRARGLTRQLLTFSKGGAPVLEVQNLGPLLSEWVGFAMSGATNSVELRVAPDLWSCLCDAQQISQVVDNLLINARQASGVGSPLVVEASNVEQSGRSLVRISVIDQGQGVPPELRQKIFEPFFSTKATGTGLGLATSTSIAVKHQGWLTVEPGPVRGSRFSLFLPAVSTPVRQELPGVVANFRGAGTALVVDDEEALRDSVGGFLTSMGFSVLLAANERQALDRCAGVWAQGRSVALGVLDLTTK